MINMLNSNLIKHLWFFLFLDFFHGALSHISRKNSAPRNTVWEMLPYSTESENCLWISHTLRNEQAVGQAADINTLGKFQTGLYQRVISRAGNNWRCRVEDQWKGKKSNDSGKRGRHKTETLNLGSFQVGVSAMTHLGRNLTSDNDGTEQVQCGISAAKKAYFPLVPLFKTKDVTHENRKHSTDQLSRMQAICGRFSQNAA
jgi:hypothetical protein